MNVSVVFCLPKMMPWILSFMIYVHCKLKNDEYMPKNPNP